MATPRFGTYNSPQQYKDMSVEARYLTMRDGVKIAVDVHLPADRLPEDKLPAIVVATRYWRKQDLRAGFKWMGAAIEKAMQFYVTHGYALLNVDVRGTGASFGTRRHEWDAEEIQDGWDISEWIIAQPWSNGHVGGYGTSYSGTTAELLTVPNHPAVKAVIPRFNEYDVYTDIAFPGGLYLQGFVEAWGQANASLDAGRVPIERVSGLERLVVAIGVRGVKPVDADRDRTLLKQAIAGHKSNIQADTISEGIVCRDDVIAANGKTIDDFSVHQYRDRIESSNAVIYGWGGWMDACTADAVLHRFMTLDNPQVAVVGAWNHGANQHASPYNPHPLNVIEHWHESLRFFDHYLKEQPTDIQVDVEAKTLFYFTMGEEQWKQTATWPPQGVTLQRWYLREGHSLQVQEPSDASATDSYTVDFEVTSGKSNRWYTQMGGGAVIYPDRADVDAGLLTYTTAPLDADTEITGHAIITLQVASTANDGAFIVYLEHVTPEGVVHYLTEGQLRALHRKISEKPAPYTLSKPYHSFKREDAQALVPGDVSELTFGLLPTSVRIPAGHRIRIAIACADKDLFPRIPETGNPTITVVGIN